MILLIFVVFPLINLMAVATGYGVAFLITNQAARQAASQPTFNDALAAMLNESGTLAQWGISRFAKLKPVGGYQGSGTDLYILATNYSTSQMTRIGPNKPVPPPVDSSTFVYEYCVPGTFDVGPMVDMSSVPFLGTVPGLGPPARICTTSDRVVEHPEGLGAVSTGSQQSFTTPIPPPNSTGTTPPGPGSGTGWNYPNIYQMIAAAGQTVISEDVLQVYANNANWTDTNIDVLPGQRVWIDLRADGLWNHDGGGQMTDADGDVAAGAMGSIDPASPIGMLVAKMGNGSPFPVGNYELNLAPPGTGRLYLIQNDGASWAGSEGLQTVRIIVTQ